jgi:hypothetical protein
MTGGKHTATTNAALDVDLKQRDPRWGVRDVDDIVSEAVPHGLELSEVVDMPVKSGRPNLNLLLLGSSSLAHGALRKRKPCRSSQVWPTLPAQKLSRRPWRTKIF